MEWEEVEVEEAEGVEEEEVQEEEQEELAHLGEKLLGALAEHRVQPQHARRLDRRRRRGCCRRGLGWRRGRRRDLSRRRRRRLLRWLGLRLRLRLGLARPRAAALARARFGAGCGGGGGRRRLLRLRLFLDRERGKAHDRERPVPAQALLLVHLTGARGMAVTAAVTNGVHTAPRRAGACAHGRGEGRATRRAHWDEDEVLLEQVDVLEAVVPQDLVARVLLLAVPQRPGQKRARVGARAGRRGSHMARARLVCSVDLSCLRKNELKMCTRSR